MGEGGFDTFLKFLSKQRLNSLATSSLEILPSIFILFNFILSYFYIHLVKEADIEN